MKTVPKHIAKKIYRMGQLMCQLTSLNAEVEEWASKNGIDYMRDLTEGNRYDDGYAVCREEEFIQTLERAINGMTGE